MRGKLPATYRDETIDELVQYAWDMADEAETLAMKKRNLLKALGKDDSEVGQYIYNRLCEEEMRHEQRAKAWMKIAGHLDGKTLKELLG